MENEMKVVANEVMEVAENVAPVVEENAVEVVEAANVVAKNCDIKTIAKWGLAGVGIACIVYGGKILWTKKIKPMIDKKRENEDMDYVEVNSDIEEDDDDRIRRMHEEENDK